MGYPLFLWVVWTDQALQQRDYKNFREKISWKRTYRASGSNRKNQALTGLCSVIKGASLFVGIDSGVMHMASCLDIPVVGLFGPTDPFYVGPQNKKSIVVREESMECVPCYLKDLVSTGIA